MRAADYLVDFGPGPGVRGGEVVAAGTPAEVFANPKSLTGAVPHRREGDRRSRRSAGRRTARRSRVVGARHNNLKNVTVEIPLGVFVCVTGVSGSGKSSLVNDILHGGGCASGERTRQRPPTRRTSDDDEAAHASARTTASRAPSTSTRSSTSTSRRSAARRGRTRRPTSRCSTRSASLYAQMPEAKVRGYQPGRFSFNKPGGRCEACEGNGSNRLEMDFLADVWVTCPVCEGRRFNRETLQVRYRGQVIHDVLEMDVAGGAGALRERPEDPRRCSRRCTTSAWTTSSSASRRRRSPAARPSASSWPRSCAAAAPARRSTSSTSRRPACTSRTSASCSTCCTASSTRATRSLVIEHNLDVIKTADWVIDLGPEGGAGGGEVVVAGTPEQVAEVRGVVHRAGARAGPVPEAASPRTASAEGEGASSRDAAGEYITHLTVAGRVPAQPEERHRRACRASR